MYITLGVQIVYTVAQYWRFRHFSLLFQSTSFSRAYHSPYIVCNIHVHVQEFLGVISLLLYSPPRAFLLAQVAMIGGYRSALKLRQGAKEVVFDEDQFLKSRPNMEEFLGQLLHFQHFRQFINGRIDKLKNRIPDRDLFDDEVMQYEEGELVWMA